MMKKNGRPFILAIEGKAAAGKSTLAEKIAKDFEASVIHMDDFFLPPNLRTQKRYEEAGGNIHYERFIEEIIEKLQSKELFYYQKFSCKTMSYEENPVYLPSQDFYIVEGAYSTHPKFGKYYDAAIFVDVDKEIQIQRIVERNGEEAAKMFINQWIPLEESYFSFFDIKKKCNYQIFIA